LTILIKYPNVQQRIYLLSEGGALLFCPCMRLWWR